MSEKKGYYRPSYAPAENIPLGARSVGHYIVDAAYKEKPAAKHFVQVFWGIRGTGAMVVDGLERRLAPNTIGIYFPGMTHEVYALADEWEYRWWTMDGALAVTIVTGFGLARSDIYEAGPAPIELFVELEKAIAGANTPSGERHASSIAFALLTCAAGGRRAENSQDLQISQAMSVIHKEWSNPLFGVEALAERVNLNRSVLSRRFHDAMGVAPVKYITNLRTQNALSLLKHSDARVAAIARQCGWHDANYFSRCIRKATGQSPEKFRES